MKATVPASIRLKKKKPTKSERTRPKNRRRKAYRGQGKP